MERLFEKFQQKSPRANHIKIRLIEPSVDVDALIKSLSEKLAPLREQDPVLLHVDTAGVSTHSVQITCSVDGCTRRSPSTFLFPARFVQVWRSSCSIC